MINLIATAESCQQAEALLDAGADTLLVGSHPFGLRLPHSLNLNEIETIRTMAHDRQKKVTVACNALLHNQQIDKLPAYLSRLAEIGVDAVTVGDPGAVFILEELQLPLPYIYDAETLVTSSRQISFWLKRGAVGAVAARELTLTELKAIQASVDKPVEVLVYGPTCIHQSARPLLTNYYHYVGLKESVAKDRHLLLRDPKNEASQYPIYEDEDGTHIFSTVDLSLMSELQEAYDAGLHTWKLDGVLLRGNAFVAIVRLFAEAARAIEQGHFIAASFCNRLSTLQPPTRPIGTGFYLKDPKDVH
ncbi:collagenase-like PrtC family protease [Sporolactobacillus spathodeae]|uniref:Collagenase-like PrtC family protease n=1 Tax=Sporolactobacillus spathodeae TaxID=1465502 RepID=A0ABS2QB21_9BACL|nr:peptidase U32 family protein [Sporolactobacillus spathodeae]MBM7658620.1 collagenase-like PrtC family protease [Sporolactobacillus spathodeae]